MDSLIGYSLENKLVLLSHLQALQLTPISASDPTTPEILDNSAPWHFDSTAIAPPPRQSQRGAHKSKSKEEQIRRTVYVNELDRALTEQDLATFFSSCGTIVDCRICGTAPTPLRFAFIEFFEEIGARRALSLSGCFLRSSAVRVSPSKTAIVPVKNEYLPSSDEERGAVTRTVYVANIHQSIDRAQLHVFFSNLCGAVDKIRVLHNGDAEHETKIAFVEFATPEGAAAALKCTGALLSSVPIRILPSKTPVRANRGRGRSGQPKHARQQLSDGLATPWSAASSFIGSFITGNNPWAPQGSSPALSPSPSWSSLL